MVLQFYSKRWYLERDFVVSFEKTVCMIIEMKIWKIPPKNPKGPARAVLNSLIRIF